MGRIRGHAAGPTGGTVKPAANRSLGKSVSFDWETLKRRTELAAGHHLSEAELALTFAERATRLATPLVSTDNTNATATLAFACGDMSFAVALPTVLRVLTSKPFTRIPGAPPHLSDVFYESGRIVSAFDPAALLGRPSRNDRNRWIVLLEAGPGWLGVAATSLLGIKRFEVGNLAPPSPGLAPWIASCLHGIAEDLTIFLDGTALVQALRRS